MTSTLIDTNVFLDVVEERPEWFAWGSRKVFEARIDGNVVVNPIIYAEISLHFSTIEALEEALPENSFKRFQLPWDAGFLAGRCFLQYRRKGGERRSPLPDFYIGAHAALGGMILMTRDSTRYRTYFPKLKMIEPS